MKNPANIETVDASRHSKLKVKPNTNMEQARDINIVAITLPELTACANNFPAVFVQNPEDKSFRLVAMFGLRPGENVYYGADNWDSTYWPQMISRHPFVIGFDDRNPDSNTVTTCLNRASNYLTEEGEGLELFTATGEESEFLKSRHQMMVDIFNAERLTDRFTKKLVELDLLTNLGLVLQPQDANPRVVTAMFTVDEAKLRKLSEEQQLDLLRSNFLPPCYLIMSSLFQLHQLIRLRNKKQDEKIASYRIEIGPQVDQPQPLQ